MPRPVFRPDVPPYDRPMAAAPWKSYRYRLRPLVSKVSFVMIGAMNNAEALREAERSLSESDKPAIIANLEKWEAGKYRPCN